MKTTYLFTGLALVALTSGSCKDDSPRLKPDAAAPADGPTDGSVVTVYTQIEHLARPGINEALLLTNDFNNGYNGFAPTFAGAPAAAVTAITEEAKTVLKALYLGVCLLDGALGLTADTGFKPAGIRCHAVGPAIWTEGTLAGVTLTNESKTAAQAYADKVFGQFIPDVMRIDTSGPSGYLTLCGDANAIPLLCGGRTLNDDVIDITYDYLLAGAAVHLGGPPADHNQFNALVSDGVNFSGDNAQNPGSVLNGSQTANNPNQGHPATSNAFPYSAPPL